MLSSPSYPKDSFKGIARMSQFHPARGVILLLGALSIAGCSHMWMPAPAPKAEAVAETPKSDNLPAGWDRTAKGNLRETEADVVCPQFFSGYHFTRIEGPANEKSNILGTCFYSDGLGRVGTLRIRRYDAANDQHALADNDKSLMAKDGTAPRILLHAGIDHGGSRMTATITRRGLLVDCSVWQSEHETPRSGFPQYCATLF
jgi:hypothetical protein